jgi:hypothetical protein
MAFLAHIGPPDRYALRDAAKPPKGEVKRLTRRRRSLPSPFGGEVRRAIAEAG